MACRLTASSNEARLHAVWQGWSQTRPVTPGIGFSRSSRSRASAARPWRSRSIAPSRSAPTGQAALQGATMSRCAGCIRFAGAVPHGGAGTSLLSRSFGTLDLRAAGGGGPAPGAGRRGEPHGSCQRGAGRGRAPGAAPGPPSRANGPRRRRFRHALAGRGGAGRCQPVRGMARPVSPGRARCPGLRGAEGTPTLAVRPPSGGAHPEEAMVTFTEIARGKIAELLAGGGPRRVRPAVVHRRAAGRASSSTGWPS